jgi:urease accessory protein
MLPAALLLLADGRSPSGAYAHSGGVEAAIAGGWIADEDDLRAFLLGRLETAGRVAAGLAAAGARATAAADDAELIRLDGEADARTLAPAGRDASRAQGRALLRMVRAAWPLDRYALLGPRPHVPIVLGVAAVTAGGTAEDAAALAAAASISGPASAAVRLLGLDPLLVTGLLASLSPLVDRIAAEVTADVALGLLPDDSAPQLDVLAEAHCGSEVRMFAS